MSRSRQSSIFYFSACVMLLPTRGPDTNTIKVASSMILLLSRNLMCGSASGFRSKTAGSRKLMGESASRAGAYKSCWL